MRTTFLVISLLAVSRLTSAGLVAGREVVADHALIKPGESVTLRWCFAGSKIVVSGGGFGNGVEVTGRSMITDQPARTTQYTFDVDLVTPPADQELVLTGPPHATYNVTVEVENPADSTTTYVHPYGWKVCYLKSWKRDNVNVGDPASNALMYFQPEEDSIERLAVSVLPVKEETPASLMQKVQADIYSRYENVQVQSKTETVYENSPAIIATFTGIDSTHPGVKTQSVLLIVVKNGLGYIISARTDAGQFALRQCVLDRLLKSFTFTSASSASNKTVAHKTAVN